MTFYCNGKKAFCTESECKDTACEYYNGEGGEYQHDLVKLKTNAYQHELVKLKTNADRIRAMSDEELAEWLCSVYDDDNCGVYQDECGKFINGTIIIDYDQYKLLEWLKQPYESGE